MNPSFWTFFKFFANNPKVPRKGAVKGTEGAEAVIENTSKIFSENPKVPKTAAVKESAGQEEGRKIVQPSPKVLIFVDVNQQKSSARGSRRNRPGSKPDALRTTANASFS